MKTAVFDKEKRIVGYLEHDPQLATRPSFQIQCQRPMTPPHQGAGTGQQVYFEWQSLAIARDQSGMYVCECLIVDDPSSLINIRGFKFYAEEHGHFVAAMTKKRKVVETMQ